MYNCHQSTHTGAWLHCCIEDTVSQQHKPASPIVLHEKHAMLSAFVGPPDPLDHTRTPLLVCLFRDLYAFLRNVGIPELPQVGVYFLSITSAMGIFFSIVVLNFCKDTVVFSHAVKLDLLVLLVIKYVLGRFTLKIVPLQNASGPKCHPVEREMHLQWEYVTLSSASKSISSYQHTTKLHVQHSPVRFTL